MKIYQHLNDTTEEKRESMIEPRKVCLEGLPEYVNEIAMSNNYVKKHQL